MTQQNQTNSTFQNQTNSTFEGIAKRMVELHGRKNYGNSFSQTYQEFAEISQAMANGYALGLLKNKVNRLLTLILSAEAKVEDESIEDFLIDLASYVIMILEEMRKAKNNGTK